jgi:uncharacterized LabA/DUF88 family protein
MPCSEKEIYAFIDSQNLNLGVRSQGWILDFRKFRKFLRDQYGVSKAYLFIGYIPENRSLYSRLRSYGYILVFKPTLNVKKGKGVKTKGNVDAELVLYAVDKIECYDGAVIVSGDGDFYCLIEYLKRKKKLVKVIAPNRKYSSLLRKFSRSILLTSSIRKKVERKK